MIVVKFQGGLGNQMLQYASYCALKNRYPDTHVLADISSYNKSSVHNGLEIEKIFPINLDVFLGSRKSSVFYKYILGLCSVIIKWGFTKRLFGKFIYVKDNNTFNSDLFNLKPAKTYYLDGYWGNPRYFEDAEATIRTHFRFKNKLEGDNEIFGQQIASANAISLHIRRGDFLTASNDFIDLSGTDYYFKAVEYMLGKVNNPSFFVFSDDVEWCRENLPWLKQHQHVYVSGNTGNKSYIDLQLMSLCKHNIIANSTFSWWGAWLNAAKDKIVVAPQNLINNKQRNKLIVDQFYPSTYILF